MTDPTKRDIESTLEDITDDDTSLDKIVLQETIVGSDWDDDLEEDETRTETYDDLEEDETKAETEVFEL